MKLDTRRACLAGALWPLVAVVAPAGCRTPTQITIVVQTDFGCARATNTAIRVGPLGDALHAARPIVETARCENGRIGSLVVVPSGDRGSEVAIEVVVGVGQSAESCAATPTDGDCYVARRALRFVPHSELDLPIDLRADCRDIPCDATTTCVHGACVDAHVPDSTQCHGDGCDDRALRGGVVPDGGVDARDAVVDSPRDSSVDSSIDSGSETTVDSGTGAAQVAAGGAFTCARKTDGTVWCWGDNAVGQLGDGTTVAMRATPSPVLVAPGGAPLTGVVEIATGATHACARASDGSVMCWGDDGDGQLGDGRGGTGVFLRSPTQVLLSLGGAKLTGTIELVAGARNACARMTDESVICWGDNGPVTPDPQPPPGGPLTGIKQLAQGSDHTCALRSDTTAVCWGYNADGEIGDGTNTSPRPTPVPVLVSAGGPSLTNIAQLMGGDFYTCARMLDGTAQCWGAGSNGALGRGASIDMQLSPAPVLVALGGAPLTGVVALTAGGDHVCARMTGATMMCWGRDGDGEIGDGNTDVTAFSPTPVVTTLGGPPLAGVVAITAGEAHTCARTADGRLWCWGANASGQIGDGALGGLRASPTLVALP